MNREEVIRMAREAEIIDFRDASDDPHVAQMVEFLERFAALVVASEREACARVCSDRAMRCELEAIQAIENGEDDESSAIRSTAWQISLCADAIRKRSKTQSMP